MQTHSGFLLSSIKYGDHDVILHCFTKENGFESFFVKNIYAKKNKKKPYLFPLNEIHFNTAVISKSSSLKNINKIERCISFDFDDDFKANSIIFFLAEFFNTTLKNETSSAYVYNEILHLKHQLNVKNYQCHLIFLIKFLHYQGCSPLFDGGLFLNAEDGKFSSVQDSRYFSEEISTIWKNILVSEDPYLLKINSTLRKEVLESVMRYYQIHVPHFRVPESWEIVQQIFD